MFLPITATPYPHAGYSEALPSRRLAPYVRCFWTAWNDGTDGEDALSVVIPDVCADIIITTDGTACPSDGRSVTGMGFCGVSDRMFRTENAAVPHRRLYGIRLYAWQASFFCDEPLCKTANSFFELRTHFTTAEKLLRASFSPDMTLPEFQAAGETVMQALLDRPARKLQEGNPLVLDAVMQMIRTRGSRQLSALLSDIHAGERQLERIFERTLSLSPKKLSSLIRYQHLWQDVCRSRNFDIQDEVLAHGYVDQSHLLNDFKKFHGMALSEALRTARCSADLSAFYNTGTGK